MLSWDAVLFKTAFDRMPGEYGVVGEVTSFRKPMLVGDEISSAYGELRSPLESIALVAVATDVRGACRLWLSGMCWPVR